MCRFSVDFSRYSGRIVFSIGGKRVKYFSVAQLQEIGTKILDAAGSPHEESVIVSEVLVRSNLMGHDSHGVLRVAQYVEDIRNGEILPGARFEIERRNGCFGRDRWALRMGYGNCAQGDAACN